MLGPVTQVFEGADDAPAGAAVIVDTGDLANGVYRIEATVSYSDTLAAGKELIFEHRNAADGATLHTFGAVPAATVHTFVIEKYELDVGEELRVINGAVAGAASSFARASIRLTRY